MAQRRSVLLLSARRRQLSLPHFRVCGSKRREACHLSRDGQWYAPDGKERSGGLLRCSTRQTDGVRVYAAHGAANDDFNAALWFGGCKHGEAGRRRKMGGTGA